MGHQKRWLIVGILGVFWLAAFPLAGTVGADSWLPPARHVYFSPDRIFRFTVIPRLIDLDRPHDGPFCKGILAKKGDDGRYHVVWERRLTNVVSPVSVLVALDGRYVVTFDDWGRMGYGDNVVVIYGADSQLIRQAKLADLISEEEIAALMHTTSSIWWRVWTGKPNSDSARIDNDGETLVVEIASRRPSRELRMDLATGRVK